MIHPQRCEEKSDNELVQLTLTDGEWYGCLMGRYEARLLRFIQRISGVSTEDAEDILQEVFINAYRNLNGFNQSLKFSSWMYRITRNAVISHHRKVTARIKLVGGEGAEQFLAMIHDDRDVHESVAQRLDGAVMQQLIGKLNPKYAEVIILRYFEEKDYTEISDILKKPVGTVGTLINRAKKQLRDLMRKEGIQL